MAQTIGFFTVATGDEHYYRIAANLLRSYRQFAKEPLPFAILADRENTYTKEFDRTILLENPASSYLDKLALYDNLPYEISIFIDADCLVYGDLNALVEDFADADDFSCFGRVLPLTDKTGWFNYEDLGDLQSKVSYCVGLHGGIYYIRRSDAARAVFETAKQIAMDYEKYNFEGRFSTPGDEPILALSMALNGCRPIPFVPEAICCYWEHENGMRLDIAGGKAVVKATGQRVRLVHWGTRFTRQLLYKREVAALKLLDAPAKRKISNWKYDAKIAMSHAGHFAARVKNKLKRMLRGK